MFPPSLLISLFLLYQTIQASPSPYWTFESKCDAFTLPPSFNNATFTVNVRKFIPANTTLLLSGNDASCNRGSQLVAVDLCRIALKIETSNTSGIVAELWLPEIWEGRVLGVGNGGIDGCIKYEDIAYGAMNGFATVGANNGKNGTSGLPFFNNPETITDFSYRSLHTSIVTAKTLTHHFYRRPHRKSYYLGCSLGGRQGVKAAEMYPSDFDGIVAGAPGVDFNNLYSWRARFYTITGPSTGPNFIPAKAWQTWIHDEVLRQCDALDGVSDGILEDPTRCRFDPTRLLCNTTSNATRYPIATPSSNATNCLNAAQVHQLTQIYSPYNYPNSTRLIYPAMQPGNEIVASTGLYAGTPWPLSTEWFKYAVYNNPAWNPSSYSPADALYSDTLDPANIRTYPPSLPAFEHRGGKLLMYHGLQDNQITSFNTIRFYEWLRGRRSYSDMDSWARFFRISGMNHCSGGPGAWVVGQGGNAAQAGVPFDKRHNVLRAMVDWVERGVAPEFIEGTKFVGDSVAKGVDFRRRHCKYPARNHYVSGDSKKPESWRCV